MVSLEVIDTNGAPEDNDYADIPYNEDGINEDGQNVFDPGAY